MESIKHMYDVVGSYVWDESIWFPPGVNWTTLRSTETEKYPDFHDMYLPIGYAFVILVIRTVFEWSIARPLGRLCGIKDTGSELPNFFRRVYQLIRQRTHPDEHHESTGKAANGHVANGSVQSSPRRSTSGRRRRLVIHKSTLDKFSESCWRGFYYAAIFVYGIWALWDKPWFWDTAHCWYGYPFQTIDREIWWYYMIEISFYWSLAFSQFVDVHRKDFAMNFVHHFATIALMWFSWADNFVRCGSLVLVVHDAVDSWLEVAKMARYCKMNNLCNALFAVFTLIWVITRLGIYPFRIIYSTMIEAPSLVGFYAAYYVFNFLLFLLQILHILWSIMILRIVLNAINGGEAEDVRSDDEEDSVPAESDSEGESTKTSRKALAPSKKNGKAKIQ